MGEKVSPPSRVRGHKSGRIFLSFFFSSSNSGSIHHAKRGSLIGCRLGGRWGGMDDPEQRSIVVSIYTMAAGLK